MAEFEVPQPIICSPFAEPAQHWLLQEGTEPELIPGRRAAHYYYRAPGQEAGAEQGTSAGEKIDLPLVNLVRQRVSHWRSEGWPGVTGTTLELLEYWRRDGREKRLFFAQLESAETIIFLNEARRDFLQGIDVPLDQPSDTQKAEGFKAFQRYACKMATGSGKTTVMGMLAAWSILNKVHRHSNATYSEVVLVVCPNVTIRSRLAELDPQHGEASLYRTRDLVPPHLMPDLAKGRVLVTNWHVFEPQSMQTGGVSAKVMKAGVRKRVIDVIHIGQKTTTARGKRYLSLNEYERQRAAGLLRILNEETDETGNLKHARVEIERFVQSDTAVVNRILEDLGGKQNILVFNDEAHHAYRIRKAENDTDDIRGDADDDEDWDVFSKEATVWVEGLDRIHKLRGINFCVDLSATPYYLGRVGQDANRPFPWVVSDFGLTDAIESGLVKIPQLAVRDSTGDDIPGYFNIWKWIVPKLTAQERGGRKGSVKPEAILKWASTPIAMLAGLWEELRTDWEDQRPRPEQGDGLPAEAPARLRQGYGGQPSPEVGAKVGVNRREAAAPREREPGVGPRRALIEDDPRPPVFIIVCKNTSIAKVVYEWLAENKPPIGIPPANIPGFKNDLPPEGGSHKSTGGISIRTIRVDSKVVHETDSGQPKSDDAQWMRFTLDTVGKTEWPLDLQGRPIYPEGFEELAAKRPGHPMHPPGRDVRCIVSVGMLTEGWDCNTVTHIVGLRPFMSQLLCEQVVGRGLRRRTYELGDDDLMTEEVAKVFGVPFQVVPFKANAKGTPQPRQKRHHVYAVPSRAVLEIRFPRVDGYRQAIRNRVSVNWTEMAPLWLDPMKIPPEVQMKAALACNAKRPSLLGPGKIVNVDLNPYRSGRREQELVFELAKDLTREYVASPSCEAPAHVLFPQLAAIAERFLRDVVRPVPPAHRLDLFLSPYYGWAIERLVAAIRPDTSEGEAPELPRYETSREPGSTADVDYWTSKDVREVLHSHLNYVVADTKKWEQSAAYILDTHPIVESFVKNAGLGFAIPYFHNGKSHDYQPDFIVRFRNGDYAIVETKGFDDLAEVKAAAADRWVAAVNADRRFGTWRFTMARSVGAVREFLDALPATTSTM